MSQQQFVSVSPSENIFSKGGDNVKNIMEKGITLPFYERHEEIAGKGVFVYYKGMLHPEKGFPTPQAVAANNFFKRCLINWIRYFGSNPISALPLLKTKTLERWIDQLNNLGYLALQPYMRKEEYQTRACFETGKFVKNFLTNLGVNERASGMMGTIISTMFEYDTAYKYPLQDIADETTIEKLKSPVKEFGRLIDILVSRSSSSKVSEHFKNFGIVRYAFYIPKIKKAYLKALNDLDLTNIQTDEADRYHMLRYPVHNAKGKSREERMKEFQSMHTEPIPMLVI